jgi:hypothetical protein
MDQAEAHLDLFGDSFNFGARKVHGFAPNIPQAWKSLWAHPMVLLCNVCQVEACFGLFGDSVSLGAR